MRLNTLKPGDGSRQDRKRVGRGIGSGLGKTCGRGHKGQKSRAGGFHKIGFEGGQMPLQRRLPKMGFLSRKSRFVDELRLNELALVDADVIDLDSLKAANLIARDVRGVKVFASGSIDRAVTLKGIRVTRGARAAIEAAGGKIED
ncbi:MAG: 50S ribosomal protein L15 [Gammaproteobacteria bacterium]|jgi:large subunit ribosomal protein L15|nr:50S ribosomal protein L15 [Gammaproteobacteria bacterium]